MSKPLRTVLIWLALVIAAICLAGPFLMLAGCATPYQPPGDGIWRSL